MATTFNFELRDATAYNPQPLNATLSASDASIVVNSFGTISGKQVVAVLYNAITNTDAVKATLSAAYGFSITVSRSFQGQDIAIEFADRTTSIVTVTTAFGVSKVQNVSAAGTEIVSPNTRRLWQLELR
jgi:hypothetical protein